MGKLIKVAAIELTHALHLIFVFFRYRGNNSLEILLVDRSKFGIEQVRSTTTRSLLTIVLACQQSASTSDFLGFELQLIHRKDFWRIIMSIQMNDYSVVGSIPIAFRTNTNSIFPSLNVLTGTFYSQKGSEMTIFLTFSFVSAITNRPHALTQFHNFLLTQLNKWNLRKYLFHPLNLITNASP